MTVTDARRDLLEKIRFERMLASELRSFNRRLSRQAIIEFDQGAGAVNAAQFQDELTGILETHYARVGEPFSSQIIDELPEDIEASNAEVIVIAAALASFFSTRAREQSEIITVTNQSDALVAVDRANMIAQEEVEAGRPQARRTTAVQAGAELSRRLSGRVGGIATLETQAAAEAAKGTEAQVLTRQLPSVTGGTLREVDVTKDWFTVGDERVRPAHVAADSQTRSLNKPFSVGGESLRWPGDTSLGASVGNVIRCLHPDSLVDANNIKTLTRRYYKGSMIRIKVSGGDHLTVTPNHPILTVNGWVFAKSIKQGDSVIGSVSGNRAVKYINIQDIKSTIEQEFESFSISGVFTVRQDSAIVNFHGEIPDHDVDIVYADGFLRGIGEAGSIESIDEKLLAFTDFGTGSFFSDCLLDSKSMKVFRSFCSDSIVCFLGKLPSLFRRGLRHSKEHSLRPTPDFDAVSFKSFFYGASVVLGKLVDGFYRQTIFEVLRYFSKNFFEERGIIGTAGFGSRSKDAVFEDGLPTIVPRDAQLLAAGVNGNAGRIEVKNIAGIEHIKYSGYVYNLETESNIYFSQGVINHNCRCSSVVSREDVFAIRREVGETPFEDPTLSEQLTTSIGDIIP